MIADEKRSIRLNTLLKFYLRNNHNDSALFNRAKRFGVSDATAKDYVKTVKIQALRSKKK